MGVLWEQAGYSCCEMPPQSYFLILPLACIPQVPGPARLQELHKALAHEVRIPHCCCAQHQVEGCLVVWPLLHDARKAVGGLLVAARPHQGQPDVAHGVQAQATEGGGRQI